MVQEMPLMTCTERMFLVELSHAKQPEISEVAHASAVSDAAIAPTVETAIVVMIVRVVLRTVIAASIAEELVIGRVSAQNLVVVEIVAMIGAVAEAAIVMETTIAIVAKVVASNVA